MAVARWCFRILTSQRGKNDIFQTVYGSIPAARGPTARQQSIARCTEIRSSKLARWSVEAHPRSALLSYQFFKPSYHIFYYSNIYVLISVSMLLLSQVFILEKKLTQYFLSKQILNIYHIFWNVIFFGKN